MTPFRFILRATIDDIAGLSRDAYFIKFHDNVKTSCVGMFSVLR